MNNLTEVPAYARDPIRIAAIQATNARSGAPMVYSCIRPRRPRRQSPFRRSATSTAAHPAVPCKETALSTSGVADEQPSGIARPMRVLLLMGPASLSPMELVDHHQIK
jgi:hypothetical protein